MLLFGTQCMQLTATHPVCMMATGFLLRKLSSALLRQGAGSSDLATRSIGSLHAASPISPRVNAPARATKRTKLGSRQTWAEGMVDWQVAAQGGHRQVVVRFSTKVTRISSLKSDWPTVVGCVRPPVGCGRSPEGIASTDLITATAACTRWGMVQQETCGSGGEALGPRCGGAWPPSECSCLGRAS